MNKQVNYYLISDHAALFVLTIVTDSTVDDSAVNPKSHSADVAAGINRIATLLQSNDTDDDFSDYDSSHGGYYPPDIMIGPPRNDNRKVESSHPHS